MVWFWALVFEISRKHDTVDQDRVGGIAGFDFDIYSIGFLQGPVLFQLQEAVEAVDLLVSDLAGDHGSGNSCSGDAHRQGSRW